MANNNIKNNTKYILEYAKYRNSKKKLNKETLNTMEKRLSRRGCLREAKAYTILQKNSKALKTIAQQIVEAKEVLAVSEYNELLQTLSSPVISFIDHYLWKDIVYIPGKGAFCEAFPISGETNDLGNGNIAYIINDFIDAVANKYNVKYDDVVVYTMENPESFPEIDFKKLPWSVEECGCYINGTAQWLL